MAALTTTCPHSPGGPSGALAELRTQRTLTYDTEQQHDWRSPVVDAMRRRGIANFATGDGRPQPRRGRGAGAPWLRKWTTRSPDIRERILAAYLSFLQRVVLPHVREVLRAARLDVT